MEFEYCICNCGKRLYYDLWSQHKCRKSRNRLNNLRIFDNFFSDNIRDCGYRDGYSHGIDIAKKDTIYGEIYDNYIDAIHIDIPKIAVFDPESYEQGYSDGYERGYHITFGIHSRMFRELRDCINLKLLDLKLASNYPTGYDRNVTKMIRSLLLA